MLRVTTSRPHSIRTDLMTHCSVGIHNHSRSDLTSGHSKLTKPIWSNMLQKIFQNVFYWPTNRWRGATATCQKKRIRSYRILKPFFNHGITRNARIRLYKVIIHSQLTYGFPIWVASPLLGAKRLTKSSHAPSEERRTSHVSFRIHIFLKKSAWTKSLSSGSRKRLHLLSQLTRNLTIIFQLLQIQLFPSRNRWSWHTLKEIIFPDLDRTIMRTN